MPKSGIKQHFKDIDGLRVGFRDKQHMMDVEDDEFQEYYLDVINDQQKLDSFEIK